MSMIKNPQKKITLIKEDGTMIRTTRQDAMGMIAYEGYVATTKGRLKKFLKREKTLRTNERFKARMTSNAIKADFTPKGWNGAGKDIWNGKLYAIFSGPVKIVDNLGIFGLKKHKVLRGKGWHVTRDNTQLVKYIHVNQRIIISFPNHHVK